MGMQILDSIRKLFREKADGMEYSNGQLQLKSGGQNIGGPISINTEGGLNAFVSGVTDYTFKASVDTNKFKLFNFNQSMRTMITKEGLSLVRGKDYSIGNDGTVTLIGITIKKGEEVDVTIFNTSMEYGEIMNRPDLNLKSDKGHTHTYAPDGYGLGSSCTIIADVHAVSANGWYMGANVINAPNADWWMYEVKVHNSLWIEVIATPFTVTDPEKNKRIKYKQNGTWSGWKDPFGAVVSGKQEIVNAINDSIGQISGLTTNNTHTDYAWWIRNKTIKTDDEAIKRFMPGVFLYHRDIEMNLKYSTRGPSFTSEYAGNDNGKVLYKDRLTVGNDDYVYVVCGTKFTIDYQNQNMKEIFNVLLHDFLNGRSVYGRLFKVINKNTSLEYTWKETGTGSGIKSVWGITKNTFKYYQCAID